MLMIGHYFWVLTAILASILEKALNLVKVFKLGSKEANDLKNHILAKAIMTI